jgi:hypothetical protein
MGVLIHCRPGDRSDTVHRDRLVLRGVSMNPRPRASCGLLMDKPFRFYGVSQ